MTEDEEGEEEEEGEEGEDTPCGIRSLQRSADSRLRSSGSRSLSLSGNKHTLRVSVTFIIFIILVTPRITMVMITIV